MAKLRLAGHSGLTEVVVAEQDNPMGIIHLLEGTSSNCACLVFSLGSTASLYLWPAGSGALTYSTTEPTAPDSDGTLVSP
jgi:hypothetical protein